MLGLICDPVAGLVEVHVLNVMLLVQVLHLWLLTWHLLALNLKFQLTKLLMSMYQVGASLPTAFRETAEGGLAATPTGRRLQTQIFGE